MTSRSSDSRSPENGEGDTITTTEQPQSSSEQDEQRGYCHIYTGNGKGKSTAAFGLAVRALMAGKKVYIAQFVKSMKYNETKLESIVDGLVIRQYGNGCFIYKNAPTDVDIAMAVDGLADCERLLNSSDQYQYDVVILDEITIAIHYNLIKVDDVVRVIQARNPKIEIIVTGRYAPQELIDVGDVVTEMKAIKHYFTTLGVKARDGIER